MQTKDFYTVTEISSAIALLFSENFSGLIKVKGEISGLNASPSNHWYFSIKDNDTLLNGVCWKFRTSSLKFVPKNGDEVFCYGKLKTYAGRSSYQLDVEKFEPFGQGDLALKLLELKEKFLKEGLFNEAHKKKLPFLPKKIGVITSPTGAVFHDILKTLEAIYPSHVVLYPVPVQGVGAGEKIAKAIKDFNEMNNVDVIIVARGGGSLEDLWEFNSEVVVRAVFDSKIPVVSGVGHETDTTLIDYVADERALTPTKAAMAVVPNIVNLRNNINSLSIRLNNAINQIISHNELKLKALKINDLSYTLDIKQQKLNDLSDKMAMIMKQRLELANNRIKNTDGKLEFMINHSFQKNKDKLKRLSELLESYSYKNVLTRGFVMIKDENENPLTSIKQINKDDKIAIHFKDGKAIADISSVISG
ncbi:MAG: Exodeoxyribonuclease 7 large subunit [Alphaproteobacteria bacterium ADurb.Bin438]|nr:MAG: Exodeoxyribonuclease 7 large subunit [Alphaproteobacteria bacterium ADurb.Bin438]